MNSPKRLICLLLFPLIPAQFYARETIHLSKKLHWADLNKVEIPSPYTLDFEGSARFDDYGDLPCFYYSHKVSGPMMVQDYAFSDDLSATLPTHLLKDIEKKSISDGWKVFAQVSEGAQSWYLQVVVIPIRALASGSYERLLSFDLDVVLEPTTNAQSERQLTFADNSVLSEGTWFKFAIARDGVYKLDRNFLNQLGIGEVQKEKINIYGNGGQLLPEINNLPRIDDLAKCAIQISDPQTGAFGNSDYILFYGKGPDSWSPIQVNAINREIMLHKKHYYSDSAYYFIRIDDEIPLRIPNQSQISASPTHTVNKFQDYQYIENDLYNLAKTGREFYGDEFLINLNQNYSFSFPNVTSDPACLHASIVARSMDAPSTFTFTTNGQTLTLQPNETSDGPLAPVAKEATGSVSFIPSSGNISINAVFSQANPDATAWIDYINVNATRQLIMAGSQMRFRDTLSVGAGNVAQFQIAGAGSLFQVWDVTDYTQPVRMSFTNNSGVVEYANYADVLHEYIAFNNNGYLQATPVGPVENQNLHSLSNIDLMIITAPLHWDAAMQLAEIHSLRGLNVAMATPLQVFNEFSSGNPDVIAFRMLMKMLYDRANGDNNLRPQNLLLFGDGDYSKTKGVANQLGYNVLVFETDKSLSPLSSSCTDDYFVYLDDNSTGSNLNLLDAGVGRIPASNRAEGLSYVEKVRIYLSTNTTSNGGASCIGDAAQSPYGAWRNQVVFVADDQDGGGSPTETYHLTISDEMAEDSLFTAYPEYDVIKIYADAYTQVPTPGGERYPEMEDAIRNRVQNGALLVAYAGHGGEKGWMHERTLNLTTIANWTNKYRLPVFFTATCELARYDDPEFNTAGEMLVMNPNGGAIAMLTTTRIVTAAANNEMNREFFSVAFDDATIEDLTIGKLNMLMKVNEGNSSKPNFSLLGDPAIKMAYPKFEVYTTHINGIPIEQFNGTLQALQEAEFTGYVGDASGNKLENFNGFVYPTVFDKKTTVYTQNNDIDGDVQVFKTFNKNIFKGKASVNGGDFSFRFVVPYDINYTVGAGRVSYYAVAGNDDAHGYTQDFQIGGSLNGAKLNTVGPEISLYLNDTTFVDGGLTSTSPVLLAKLKDENGINTVGNGIGHDITAVLDGDTQNPLVLNEYYETDLDTYQSGEVRYQLTDLLPGEHTLQFKAWDVHNNSNTSSLTFFVAENSTIALDHVLNYPNPFTTSTQFMFEHNQACTNLDVRIQIFTVSGKLVKTLTAYTHQNGYRVDGIMWDGRDEFGEQIGKGVYVYKVEVRNENGQQAEQFEKLVILK